MERKAFEAMLQEIMTDELYEHIRTNVEAEILLGALFGPEALEEDAVC